MHGNFSEWYEGLSLGQDDSYLESRWAAVESVVEDATKETLEELVRLAFRTKPANDVAELRAKFAGEIAPPGDEELAVLAGAALVWAMHPDDDNSALAAAMIATASCGGLRELKLPIDLVSMSTETNRELSEAARRRPSLDVGKAVATTLDKTEVANAIKQANEVNVGTGLQALVVTINKALGTVAKRQAAVETEFERYTKLQDEELDILWWLHGGYSTDFQNDFAEVPAPLRPLGFARELASLTTVLPGPTAVSALFTRAGVPAAPVQTIVAAVQEMPVAWLDIALGDLKKDSISAITTPILFALLRRKELDGDQGWVAAWSKLTAMAESATLESLPLAEAAYREFVVARLG